MITDNVHRFRHGWNRLRALGATALILWVGGLVSAARERPADASAGASYEPSVTEEEAEWLRAAAALAEQDPGAAARLLEEKRTEDISAAIPFAAAVYYLADEDHDSAIAAWRQALERMPRFHRARASLATVLVQAERHGEAVVELRKLLNAPGQDDGMTWRLLAYALLQDGQTIAAEQAYRTALIHDPRDAELLLGLLRALLDQGRTQDVVPLARIELRRDPTQTRFWRLLVNAALEQQNHEEAMILLESCRRLGAAEHDMLGALADLYLERGMAHQAADAYLSSQQKDAPPEKLLGAIEALLATGHDSEAQRLLQAAEEGQQELLPDQKGRLARLGAELAIEQNREGAAMESLRQALALNPLDGHALLMLAERVAADNPEGARELYRRALHLERFKVRAWAGLASLEVSEERYAAALEAVRQALAMEPDPRMQRFHDDILQAVRRQEEADAEAP